MKFLMRERIFGIGNDHWITTEHGEKAFLVDGKALRVRETFELKDHATGEVVAVIKKKMISVRDAMVIERHHGGKLATVKKKLVTVFRDKYLAELDGSVGGGEIEATGNFTDHEFHLERDGRRVAVISKKWFGVHDHYAIDVADDEDIPLMLCIAVCVEHLDAEEHH